MNIPKLHRINSKESLTGLDNHCQESSFVDLRCCNGAFMSQPKDQCQGLKSPVWWIWWRIEFRYFQIARNIRRQMDGYLLVHLVFCMRCFSRERFFGQHRWKQPPLANHHRAILSPEFSRAWRGETRMCQQQNTSHQRVKSDSSKFRLPG